MTDIENAETGGRNAGGVTRTNLLTAAELAARWQVARSQVYSLTRTGVLPAVRLGKYVRYRLDAIEEFERNGGMHAE
jgi:excisionase family DNA binding protein